MKICIVGASGHYGYVLEGLAGRPDARVAAVSPGSPGEDISRLFRAVEEHGSAPAVYERYQDMLDAEKPDVVAVACHFTGHAAVATEALRRGIHVFVEKPIANSLEELEALKDAWRRSGAHLAAMFGLRCAPWFRTAKKLVDEGAVGEVRLLHAQKSYKLGTRGALFRSHDTYCGTIPWVGSHGIDLCYWLSGERFVSVYASHTNRANRGHGDLEMTGLCHFTLTNEVFASVSIDYLRPGNASGHADDRIRIAGTGGILEVRGDRVYLLGGAEGAPAEVPPEEGEGIFAGFLRQIEGKGHCSVSAEDSFLVTEACLRARQSADEKRIVYF